MGKCYDIPQGPCAMRSALRAILARIDGDWTQPDLWAFGPLCDDTFADVRSLAHAALAIDAQDDPEGR